MKKALLFSAGLLSASLIFAQSAHTLLWKVSGKGLSKPSYLFGTMHVLCAEDAQLSESLKSVISDCDEIYFEIKLDDMNDLMGAMRYMRMNDSKKLSDLLSVAEYQKVKDYFAKHAAMLPFGMLERFKPLLISSLIEEEGLECKTTNGMELMIMKETKPLNKPIRGLETMEFQAGLFDSIPYEKQARDLVNYIDSVDEYKKMTLKLAGVYRDQDLDKIDELSRKGDPGMDGYMDLLLYDRNRKWAKTLTPLFRGKSLLIAVGAAHLPGDQGVISLLRKAGYTVTPMKNQPPPRAGVESL